MNVALLKEQEDQDWTVQCHRQIQDKSMNYICIQCHRNGIKGLGNTAHVQ